MCPTKLQSPSRKTRQRTVLGRLGRLLLNTKAKGGDSPWLNVIGSFERSDTSCASDQRLSVQAHGLWGSQGRLLAALLVHQHKRSVLYVTAHIPDADFAQDDLETFLEMPVDLFAAMETASEKTDPTSEIACQRLRLCRRFQSACHSERRAAEGGISLSETDPPRVVVCSAAALMQPIPSEPFIQSQSLQLTCGHSAIGGDGGPEELARWCVEREFEHVDQVDAIGHFARRGGIVDVFCPGEDQPLRIEFFGDQIESLRTFDLDTQRSSQSLESMTLLGCESPTGEDEQTMFLNTIPADTVVVFEESLQIAETAKLFQQRMEQPQDVYPIETVFQKAGDFDCLTVNRFFTEAITATPKDDMSSPPDGSGEQRIVELPAQSVQRFENQAASGLAELLAEAAHQHVFLYCENPAQRTRMLEILKDISPKEPPKRFSLVIGYIHQGFCVPDSKLIVLSHHELFGQAQLHRRLAQLRPVRGVDTFGDLEPNDLVVHVDHGIGRFLGIRTLEKNTRREEFLSIEFADKAVVHAPAGKINLIHKYVGAGGVARLSRLGSKTWDKQKHKVSCAVEKVAKDMLNLQAARSVKQGIAYPADTAWQNEFEACFTYQETDDQIKALAQIKQDMLQPKPMDRLLCGDVGYGKTELALRAAFKAVEYGKQVAVLVPTTVLAQQHYRTFRERLADFPFLIEVLSRFKSLTAAKAIIRKAARGQVDIVIGTHRLLSDDVTFKDLGLVIIDEEQRFGVAHKEKLMAIRETVDVLTLTATPIPRTLHLALLGLRDISSLATPPLDRRSIVTELGRYDSARIRQAILNELARGGQIYFVHNRVKSIRTVTAKLQKLVPEARVIMAHGQMPHHELEERMLDFVEHKADVLVCTTIIESGLDIPTANTIIIADADRFGLAQLHQLRGRVGRYKNRAFAYVLLPQKRTVTPKALKRLKAIEEYSQLGSGFRIAMRDLEIRGAGNILGSEQSGHIDAVGYGMYCRLLASSVRKLQRKLQQTKETPAESAMIDEQLELPSAGAHLELNVHNHIPRGYVASDKQRMAVYRRLTMCSSDEDLQKLRDDLRDWFGPVPQPVVDLLELARLRNLAARWAIRSIVQHEPDLIFTMESMKHIKELFRKLPAKIRILDDRTVYLRLEDKMFEPPAVLMTFLDELLENPPAPNVS